jgi:hypothetical protein
VKKNQRLKKEIRKIRKKRKEDLLLLIAIRNPKRGSQRALKNLRKIKILLLN